MAKKKARGARNVTAQSPTVSEEPFRMTIPEISNEVKVRRVFTQLEREATMGLLNTIGHAVHVHWVPSNAKWRNDLRYRRAFDEERRRLDRSWRNPGPLDPAALFGERSKEPPNWGYLMSRAFHEVFWINGERPNVGMVDNFDADLLLSKWRELFVQEVHRVVNLWPGTDDVRHGLSALIDGLSVDPLPRTNALIVALQSETDGRPLLMKIDAERKRIVEHLKAMRNEHFPQVAETGIPAATGPSFTWKGHPHELFELVEELIGKGWLGVPKHRGKVSRAELARRIHAAFEFNSGERLERSTAESYLKPKGPRPSQGVTFTLPKNPRSEPDKSDE